MRNFEINAREHDEGSRQDVPTKDRGDLPGREVTDEHERKFLLKELATARRKKK